MRGLHAFHFRYDGSSAGRKDQMIIRQRCGVPRIQIFYQYRFFFGINTDNLVSDTDVNVEPRTKTPGSLQCQLLLLGDNIPNIIRQPAVGKRNKIAPFQNDNLFLFQSASQPGRSGSPASYAAYNHGSCFHTRSTFPIMFHHDCFSSIHCNGPYRQNVTTGGNRHGT